MHVLAQVRAAAVAVLTGLPTTGARVYTQEGYAWRDDQVPGLVVTSAGDPVAESLDWPSDLRWDITLQVTAFARGTGALADLMDTIAGEVQAALCALATVGGQPVSVIPVTIAVPEFSVDGDQPVARRLITFDVRSLYTAADDPGTLI